jgi:hypothetical protein
MALFLIGANCMIHHKSAALFLTAILLITIVPSRAASHTEAIAAAAQQFLQSLDEEQRKNAMLPLDTNERATWSNLPIIMVQPAGVLVKDMTDEQRRAVHRLMRATMSSQGYAKFSGIMLLDDLLHQIDSQALQSNEDRREDATARAFVATRSYENYAIAIFGDPGDANWGWKIAGHHAAANFTISEGRLSFTPTFLGSSPMEVQNGRYAGLMALSQEGQRGIDFMNSLDSAQQEQATVADEATRDVFEGPGRRNSLENHEGLQLEKLNEEQKRLLHRLIAEYLHNADHDAAHAQMAAIREAGWEKLWFSWRGPVAADSRFYYRVHGPRILIEYNRQNANHDHSIVRDPSNDYGEDWLGKHYEEHHPSFEQAIENARRRAASQSATEEN